MDRQEAIKALQLINLSRVHPFYSWEEMKEVRDMAIEALKNQQDWIPCSEAMPDEHDSMFAEFKGTNKWHDYMFEKISDNVNATLEFEDGTRITKTMHTTDGYWRKETGFYDCKVVAWQPLPEPWKGDEK